LIGYHDIQEYRKRQHEFDNIAPSASCPCVAVFRSLPGRWEQAAALIREIKPVKAIFEEKFRKETLDVVRQAAWKDGCNRELGGPNLKNRRSPRKCLQRSVVTGVDGMRARRIFYETDFLSGAFAGITTHKVR
jgi:hypothetical protein